jgi:hypothetical protein
MSDLSLHKSYFLAAFLLKNSSLPTASHAELFLTGSSCALDMDDYKGSNIDASSFYSVVELGRCLED